MGTEAAPSVGSDIIAVWTIEGYEGRCLDWNGDSWQATDYHNFRHSFSPPQPLESPDIEALRKHYGVAADVLDDDRLISTAPDKLRQLHSQKKLSEKSPRRTDETSKQH